MSDTNTQAVVMQQSEQPVKRSLIEAMSREYDMEASAFLAAIQQVVFPAKDRNGLAPTQAQMIAYLAVCHQYGMNPFVRQLWPFPMKTGGFIPAMSYDGWLGVMNNQAQFDGEEYEEERDEKGNLVAGIIKIFRKDRSRPVIKRCKLSEWRRDTDNWRTQESHMLELRTYCQGIRKAFGINGVYEPDELERMEEKNITGESTELERSTNISTSKLKEKIEAKKEKIEKAKGPSMPEQKEVDAPPTGTVGEGPVSATSVPAPVEPTVTTPAPAPAPEAKMTEEQRQAFLKAASTRGFELKLDEAVIKTKMREIVFSAGATKFVDLPASKFDEAMQLAKTFTV